METGSCLVYYYSSYNWGFSNNLYLNFNPSVNFTTVPNLGLPNDINLVSYWNFDEGSGNITHDSSAMGNNGEFVNSPSWVTGKFGSALSFNKQCISIADSLSLSPSSITISLWVSRGDNGSYENLVSKTFSSYRLLFWTNGTLCFDFSQSDGTEHYPVSIAQITDANFHFVVVTYDATTGNYAFYVDGVNGGKGNFTSGSIAKNSQPLIIGSIDAKLGQPFNGIIDDVRIFNRSISAAEVATLYTQPDPVSVANYYSYQDPVTNNIMLIHVDNANINNNDIALVTCANFFENNTLAFNANSTATVNVWTNLGQPSFSTGIWNSQNNTSTISLDDFTTSQINWKNFSLTVYSDAHSSVSPLNVTVP